MTTLTLTALSSHESPTGVYNIVEDYTILGGTFVMPANKTLKFNGGSINNGTLQLGNNLLLDMVDGSINAKIAGTIQNTVIRTKQISGIDNLRLSDYSGKTINCDLNNDVLNHVFILNNTNTTLNTTFDGMNNIFTCNVTFFQICGQSNVTIKNFNATASVPNICFEDMPSTAVNVTGVDINHNTLYGFNVGISLNCENASYTVNYCTVSDNYIVNNSGTSSGQGYGIHMAHANHCTISNNTIVACGRHSIYHGYGDRNIIQYNNIINHRIYQSSDLSLSAAVDVSRKSTNLTISGNTFTNCYNICILVYAFPHSFEPEAINFDEKYGCCENITISNNTFHVSAMSIDHGFASIMLGYLHAGDNTSYSDFVDCHVKDVTIYNNNFYIASTENLKCIRIDQCKYPQIKNNTIRFTAPSTGHEKNLIEIRGVFKNAEIMMAYIQYNNFHAMDNITNYIVNCVGELYSLRNTLFDITVSDNTFVNQYNGNDLNFRTYQPYGITSQTSSNLHLQAEALQ